MTFDGEWAARRVAVESEVLSPLFEGKNSGWRRPGGMCRPRERRLPGGRSQPPPQPPEMWCFEMAARLRWAGLVSITPARSWRRGAPDHVATESGSASLQTTSKWPSPAHRPDEFGCPAPESRWLGGQEPHSLVKICRENLVEACINAPPGGRRRRMSAGNWNCVAATAAGVHTKHYA